MLSLLQKSEDGETLSAVHVYVIHKQCAWTTNSVHWETYALTLNKETHHSIATLKPERVCECIIISNMIAYVVSYGKTHCVNIQCATLHWAIHIYVDTWGLSSIPLPCHTHTTTKIITNQESVRLSHYTYSLLNKKFLASINNNRCIHVPTQNIQTNLPGWELVFPAMDFMEAAMDDNVWVLVEGSSGRSHESRYW